MIDQWIHHTESYILCYSIARRSTFDHVKYLMEEVRRTKDLNDTERVVAVCGNKFDLTDYRQVAYDDGKRLVIHGMYRLSKHQLKLVKM